MNNLTSPLVMERNQDDDTTVTDYSQSEDDISMPTTEDTIDTVSRWPLNKGHKRSQSNTIDYSHSSAATATVVHRRSSSFDVVYEKIKKLPASDVDGDFLSMVRKDDKQDKEHLQQEEEHQQPQLTASRLCRDEVDFSSMFGKWKGNTYFDSYNCEHLLQNSSKVGIKL